MAPVVRSHFLVAVTQHIWTEYLERAMENEYTSGIRELYQFRKQTIERSFALAKELHGFRYTQQYGTARMNLKSALTFACMNLKKLAKRRWRELPFGNAPFILLVFSCHFRIKLTTPLLA